MHGMNKTQGVAAALGVGTETAATVVAAVWAATSAAAAAADVGAARMRDLDHGAN